MDKIENKKKGQVKNLRVHLHDGPGIGNKTTFTLMLNEKPTDLAVTLEGRETESDISPHEVAVTEDDVLTLRLETEPVGKAT